MEQYLIPTLGSTTIQENMFGLFSVPAHQFAWEIDNIKDGDWDRETINIISPRQDTKCSHHKSPTKDHLAAPVLKGGEEMRIEIEMAKLKTAEKILTVNKENKC